MNTGTPLSRAKFFKSTLEEIKLADISSLKLFRFAVAAPEFSHLDLDAKYTCFHLGHMNKRSSNHICRLVYNIKKLDLRNVNAKITHP